MRAGRSGWPGDVVQRGKRRGAARPSGRTPVPYASCGDPTDPGRRGRRRRRSLRRAERRARGRARGARLRRARSPRPRPTGRRAALAAALAVDDSPELPPRGHAERPAAGSIRRSAAEVLCAEAPGARARPRGARRALRRRPPRRPRARPRGRPQRAGASCTPAAARPAGGSCAQLSRRRGRGRARSTCSRAAAPRACSATATGAAPACCSTTAGRSPPAPSILATGGAAALWSRTTNPPGSFGSGLLLARARRRRARRPRAHAVPPRPRVAGVRGPRGLPDHRGGARRGRDAARPATASASWTSSRRATRSPARSPASCGAPARRRSSLDMRWSTRPLPQRRRRAARAPASTRRASCVPVAPAAHYVMGGIVTDLHGARRRRAGPLRGRRVRLHRPARRQPAGLELAVGVLRVRPPRRAGRRSTSRAWAPRRRPRPAGRAGRPAPSRETRAAVWRLAGLERDAAGLPGCWPTRTRSRGSSPRCALAREETRGAHVRARVPGARSGARFPPHRARAGRRRAAVRNLGLSREKRSTSLNAKSTKSAFVFRRVRQ